MRWIGRNFADGGRDPGDVGGEADPSVLGEGVAAGGGVDASKVLAEVRAERPENVPAFVPAGDGRRVPRGLRAGEIDD